MLSGFRSAAVLIRTVFLFTGLGVLGLCSGPGSLPSGQDLKKRHVAILFPFESAVGGTGPVDAAIRLARIGPEVVFHPEYLDANRFRDSRHEESVVRYLRSVYAPRKVDAVLGVGFAGLSFALRHSAEIFGNAPVVFLGVEQSRLEGLHLPPNYTGVTHFDDVRGMLDTALRLQPDTTEVAVVAGTSEYDQYWLRHDRLIFDQLSSRVHFRYLTDLPMLALLQELSHLKPHTIVFLHAFSRDAAGQEFTGDDMPGLIAKNTNAPLYGLTARQGFVGGPATGEDDQRYLMAVRIVNRIVAGEKASDIPIQQAKPKYPYVFDARELRHWKIDANRVPPGSLLLNEEPTFWQLHRKLILSAAVLFALESVLIAILLIQRERRKKAELLLEDRNLRLQESEQSLRHLSGQLIDAQEEERKRIARELHDDLNQQVADLGISLSNIKRGVPVSMEGVRGELASMQNRLLTLSDGLRHVSHELHPGMLELFGLVAALKSHCKEFSAITHLPVEFQADCGEPVAPDAALSIYRITQEALRNTAKHSRATQARVSLIKAGNLLRLEVSDDGVGFDVPQALAQGGLGLRSMEERVWLVHGKLDVISRPGEGTALTVTIEFKDSPRELAPVRTMTQGTV